MQNNQFLIKYEINFRVKRGKLGFCTAQAKLQICRSLKFSVSFSCFGFTVLEQGNFGLHFESKDVGYKHQKYKTKI